MSSKVIHEQSFGGWESLQDWDRDMSECLDADYNPNAKDIPDMFTGTIKVLIWYEPSLQEQKNVR